MRKHTAKLAEASAVVGLETIDGLNKADAADGDQVLVFEAGRRQAGKLARDVIREMLVIASSRSSAAARTVGGGPEVRPSSSSRG